MDFKTRICFSFYKSYFFDLLNDNTIFERMCKILRSERLIDSVQCEELIDNYHDKNTRNSMEKVFNLLQQYSSLRLIITLQNFNTEFVSDFIEMMKDFDYVWKNLIGRLKRERRNDFGSLPLLPFGLRTELTLDEIVSSVRMVKVKKQNIMEELFYETDVKYETFYKNFFAAFDKIIVRGEPGMGKSVHVKYLIHLWAKDRWSNDNDKMVLKIILKEVEPKNGVYEEIKKKILIISII